MNSKTKLIHCGRGDQGAEVRSVNPTRASTILFKDHTTWQKYKKLKNRSRFKLWC